MLSPHCCQDLEVTDHAAPTEALILILIDAQDVQTIQG